MDECIVEPDVLRGTKISRFVRINALKSSWIFLSFKKHRRSYRIYAGYPISSHPPSAQDSCVLSPLSCAVHVLF